MTAAPWPDLLRRGGAAVVLAVVAARLVTVFAPQVVFDVDPARFAGDFGGAGPALSLWLDVAALLGCAAALAGETLAGRRLDRWPWILVALPVPVVLWHGLGDLGDLRRGAGWATAAVVAVTLAQLARDAALRALIVAVLLGAVAPLLVRGALQVTIEHRETIAAFDANRDAFLAEKGWAEGSPAARIYERRLRQPQPRGWFVTANVFASVAAAALVAWLGLAEAARRRGAGGGWVGAPLVLAACAAALLWTAGSKGATLAAVAGAALLAVALAARRRRGWIAWGPLALPLVALLAVVVRGTVLPERFAGDLSLLFRWHYAEAAARIVAAAPLLGVGPDGFQAAYMLVRDARSPEEVTSAHGVLFDWLATLGVAATAWIALLALLLRRAAAAADAPPAAIAPAAAATGPVTTLALSAVAIGLAAGIRVEAPALDAVTLAVRIAGLALGLLTAALVLRLWRGGDARAAGWALAAAATVLAVHGQIEMTFFSPGAAPWSLALLGAAAAGGGGVRTGGGRRLATVVALGIVALAAWLAVTGAVPATARRAALEAAAAELRPIGEARRAARIAASSPSVADRVAAAERAGRALLTLGIDPASIAGGVDPATIERLLAGVEPARRRRAAARLEEAFARCPTDAAPLEAAATQLALAAAAEDGPARSDALRAAGALATRAVEAGGGGRAAALAATIAVELARLTGDDLDWARAADLARRLAASDPRGVTGWKRLGDVLWESGRRAAAAEAYEQALEADASFELDPLKQLPGAERAEIARRVERATGERIE